MNTNLIFDLAIERIERLNKIAEDYYRPLNLRNIDAELKVSSDYSIASNDNHETTLEMIERFKAV